MSACVQLLGHSFLHKLMHAFILHSPGCNFYFRLTFIRGFVFKHKTRNSYTETNIFVSGIAIKYYMKVSKCVCPHALNKHISLAFKCKPNRTGARDVQTAIATNIQILLSIDR